MSAEFLSFVFGIGLGGVRLGRVVKTLADDWVVDTAADTDLLEFFLTKFGGILEELSLLLKPIELTVHPLVGFLDKGMKLWFNVFEECNITFFEIWFDCCEVLA